jgi:hypothetical protein
MNKKLVLIPLLLCIALTGIFQTTKATSITTATLDKTTYLAGETGYISVSIYNDKNDKIRVIEPLTATISYYYADNTVYQQKFFTSATLPDEISAGQTETYQIPISLPTNIAHGYTNPLVEARTELWNEQASEWRYSDHPTYTLKLYIESPYKEQYETSQQQLEEQQTTNANLNNNVNMLAVTTIAFAGAAAFLMFMVFTKRARPIPQA